MELVTPNGGLLRQVADPIGISRGGGLSHGDLCGADGVARKGVKEKSA